MGPRLVAKSARYHEHLRDVEFHRTFLRTQSKSGVLHAARGWLARRPARAHAAHPTPGACHAGEAEQLAQNFNRRLCMGPAWQVRFLPCYVFGIIEPVLSSRPDGLVEVLVEEELEGRFQKW